MSDTKSFKSLLVSQFKTGLDADAWGQSLEAAEIYQQLNEKLTKEISILTLSIDERSFLMKFKHCLQLRSQTLHSTETQQLAYDQLKKLYPLLEFLFTNKTLPPFPIHLRDFKATDTTQTEISLSLDAETPLNENTQLPPGSVTLTLFIDRFGIKDASNYLSPFVSVDVICPDGEVLEKQQTPVARNAAQLFVEFKAAIQLQTTLMTMKKRNTAVFLEFVHYKPKKKKNSTKCFAILEYNEIQQLLDRKEGTSDVVLELYQKPIDPTRKKLKLFTIKKLYAHISVTFNKH